MSEHAIRRVAIRGRVQGVGFRAYVEHQALRHGVVPRTVLSRIDVEGVTSDAQSKSLHALTSAGNSVTLPFEKRPLALGLLAWDYFVWKEARPKLKGWLTRKLLTFSLAAGVAPMIPWWIPAGQPPGQFLSMISRYQGLPVLLAWGVVLVVTIVLCIDPESRDYLLGHGRTLSIVSTGMLVLVLAMTLIGWSLTY